VAGEPALSLPGAFVVYLGQLIALVAVLLVLRGADWVDGPTFAAVAVVATLVWQVGQVLGFRRARHEIYPDVMLPGQER
jgi:membrane protein implicated in regulation of membrane protease activity